MMWCGPRPGTAPGSAAGARETNTIGGRRPAAGATARVTDKAGEGRPGAGAGGGATNNPGDRRPGVLPGGATAARTKQAAHAPQSAHAWRRKGFTGAMLHSAARRRPSPFRDSP